MVTAIGLLVLSFKINVTLLTLSSHVLCKTLFSQFHKTGSVIQQTRKYNLHYNEVRGDILRPTQVNRDPLEARNPKFDQNNTKLII